ncbi:MAG: VOC family protein [Chloroflexi bacterium]|nr:VOC family protein [Chloroflexota bacterium]
MPGGRISHIEFPADDMERAKRFYRAVAGWEPEPMEGFDDIEFFQTAHEEGGAIGRRGVGTGQVVRAYITVPSLDASLAAVEEHGGSVVEGATEVPGMGRYAVVLDSEGSEIGLWEDPPAAG